MATWNRYGILNHRGEVWTPNTFETERLAEDYLDKRRAEYRGGLDSHKVSLVTVSIMPEKPE